MIIDIAHSSHGAVLERACGQCFEPDRRTIAIRGEQGEAGGGPEADARKAGSRQENAGD